MPGKHKQNMQINNNLLSGVQVTTYSRATSVVFMRARGVQISLFKPPRPLLFRPCSPHANTAALSAKTLSQTKGVLPTGEKDDVQILPSLPLPPFERYLHFPPFISTYVLPHLKNSPPHSISLATQTQGFRESLYRFILSHECLTRV